jgi:hypothetical protein
MIIIFITCDDEHELWIGQSTVAYFKVISQYFPEGTEENEVKHSTINKSVGL